MKKLFPFVVALLFHYGCISNHSEIPSVSNVLTLNLDKDKRIEHLSKICDSVTLIPIETNDTALIGNIDKICVSDSLFYIQSTQRIFVVDYKGRVRRIINRIGHSETEYIRISDFCISDSSIFIMDYPRRLILDINKNTERITSLHLDYYHEKLSFINDTLLLLSATDKEVPILSTYNTKAEKYVDSWFVFEDRLRIPLYSHFHTSKNQTLYWQPCSSTIYSIDSIAKLTSKYFIDFGKYNFDEDNLVEVEFFGGMTPIDSKGSAQIGFAIETDKYLEVEFNCLQYSERGLYIALIDNKTNETLLIDSEKFLDDILYATYRLVPDFSTSIGNDYVGIIYPTYWKESVENANYEGERFEWAKQYTSKLDDSMNPIIAIYHIK